MTAIPYLAVPTCSAFLVSCGTDPHPDHDSKPASNREGPPGTGTVTGSIPTQLL